MSEKHALERREKHFSISSIGSKLIPHREEFDHLQLTTAILLKESWIPPSASNKLLQAVKGTSEKITDNKANAADYASAHLLFLSITNWSQTTTLDSIIELASISNTHK